MSKKWQITLCRNNANSVFYGFEQIFLVFI